MTQPPAEISPDEDHVVLVENKRVDATYTRDTPFLECLEDFRRVNICREALAWSESQYEGNTNITFGEAVDRFVDDQDIDEAVARGMLRIYDGQLAPEIRASVIEKITDPASCFHLWQRLENLTPEESAILESKFEGKLPNIEKDLDQLRTERAATGIE